MKPKIKVLIVDDSAVVRQTLADILSSDPAIEVMATAADPLIAVERLRDDVPDVITLDVEMPRMDGITFLKKIMSQHPIPIVMCSSLTGSGSETALKALEYGAVDIVEKPRMGAKQFLEEARTRICDVVKAAAVSRIRKSPPPAFRESLVAPKLTADAVLEKPDSKAMIQTTEKIIVVGASTGGTEAIRYFLESMPHDAPGIVIVQHMPEKFTEAFATRLDGLCRISVKEAADNDTVIRGRALIAPGNRHMLLKRSGARYYVEIKDGPLVCRHRPSVDVLFRSGARYAGKNAIGVIMTGMGDDGSRGMLEMMEAGAYTIAQDEDSCVVFGMPKKAIELGAVKKILPLEKLHEAALERARMV
jgi:two-component system, chemotaxis family, protein-glutamate methylesterase/glutaminase